MLTKDAFIEFILKGPGQSPKLTTVSQTSALPDGFEGFEAPELGDAVSSEASTFARRLLEASAFGYPELLGRESVIRSTDAVAKYLPERVAFWPKNASRPFQTLLFESTLTSSDLLKIPAFQRTELRHLNDVEAAVARLLSEALEGFQRGGDSVTADVRKGRKAETLCVISIIDEREADPVRLVCLGTQNESNSGLETFQITEGTRLWDGQLAREHLGLLYERQFRKLAGKDWQDAFTTTEERKQAEKLLSVCTRRAPKVADIQEVVLDLLDTIAKGFGLKKRPHTQRRLQAFELPADHDIGIDPDERASKFGGQNPFGGVTLRDERSRLLGYIIYPLKAKGDAAHLREHLEANNRFHNVLVVYPDQDQASLELWQGRDQLLGKLRQGQEYKDAADIVNLLSRFFVVSKAKVRNPSELAQELAYRARYLRRLARYELKEEKRKGPLRSLYNAFKEALVHDQTEDDFADAFAQTITYGLLTARWLGNDQLAAAGERLTRRTALKYLAAGNQFLNELFRSVLAVRLDEQQGRLLWLVDDIADLLDRIDVQYVFGVGDVGEDTATDPVIHFYEPFLAAYDKELKYKRGVFFTPRPIVSYIVRSVHEFLQSEFGLKDGLASSDTWGDVAKRTGGLQIPEGAVETDAFVLVLDPAVGTGTFLYECIDVIERVMKERWCQELKTSDWQAPEVIARWNVYVREQLLPRIFGYELMMASYAVAHLKLAFKLGQTGYRHEADYRLNVYLTNSLEPASDRGQQKLSGAFPALAHEARAVSAIKRNKRFTVVVGNPPYSGHSSNVGEWISQLVDDYYSIDGEPLRERNSKWLQDDYVKFIRLAQNTIAATGTGILGFVTNHSFLDNPTFRAMRHSLLSHFTQSYFLDLHGNLKKKEAGPDDTADENVFDIQQGVAVSLLVRHLSKNPSELRHADLYGSRRLKYAELAATTVSSTRWKVISCTPPLFLFFPQDVSLREEYEAWIRLPEFMPVNVLGFQSHRDSFAVAFEPDEMRKRIGMLRSSKYSDAEIAREFELSDNRDWQLAAARSQVRSDKKWEDKIIPCAYRPFDMRSTYFSTVAMDYPRRELLDHVAWRKNLCINTTRQTKASEWRNAIVTSCPAPAVFVEMKDGSNVFPLWLYPQPGALNFSKEPVPNLAPLVLQRWSELLELAASSKHCLPKGFTAQSILHYIYAVFYSPSYRNRYATFLKSDFPRVPLARKVVLLRALANLGAELVALHLLESAELAKFPSSYSGTQNPLVEKVSYDGNTVWIDKAQTSGFKGVPEPVWNLHVGGYQVCEKWLKDRKGRRLKKADFEHYQQILVALSETIRLTKEIDEVVESHGGWPGAFATSAKGDK